MPPQENRLPNKALWNLEDIVALSSNALDDWDRAFELAERSQDPLMLVYLGRIGKTLADIRAKAKDARNNEYDYALRNTD